MSGAALTFALRSKEWCSLIVSNVSFFFYYFIDDTKKLRSPESKTEVRGVLGVMGFTSTYIINFHVDEKCLYELANTENKIQWLPCHETVFRKLKDKFCHDIANAIPNTV